MPWRCPEQQAALVCRLAAQRRASCAWRAEPRPRARAPPMATRQVTARARAWRSESHPASLRFYVSYTTTFSVSHCRPVPTAHTVTLYYAFSDAPSTCALTVARHSAHQLRDSAARGRAIEATLEVLLHGMLLRHAAQPPRLGDASAAPVVRGLRMHQMRPGGTSRAVHAMTQHDTIGRERAQNDGIVLVRREDDLHPCQAPQSAKEERL